VEGGSVVELRPAEGAVQVNIHAVVDELQQVAVPGDDTRVRFLLFRAAHHCADHVVGLEAL